MMQASMCVIGYLSSAILSYALVGAWHAAFLSGSEVADHIDTKSVAVDDARPSGAFRPELVWHRSAHDGIRPAFGGRRETGIRYVSAEHDVVLAVRIEFASDDAARAALERVRSTAVADEPYESGLGSIGRYIPQTYIHARDDIVTGHDVTQGVRTRHAVLWSVGDRLEGVCGPNYDSVHRLILWTHGRPFGG